jgi:hypothetical protein
MHNRTNGREKNSRGAAKMRRTSRKWAKSEKSSRLGTKEAAEDEGKPKGESPLVQDIIPSSLRDIPKK